MPDIGEEEVQAATRALRSGWLTTGNQAATFEREFAEFLGGDGLQAVAVNSATAGLHLALEAAGVGPGDEVIVPTWTFTATAEVVRYLGATPILVDVDRETLCIDYTVAEQAVSRKTRAVMPVHFAGLAVDTKETAAFAAAHDLLTVEDAAHILPGTSHGELIGSGNSLASVFSFYATKTITTGEGGMLVTRYEEIADRARTMRLHGINKDVFDRYTSSSASWFYEVVAPGYKYNLPDPAAAIGRVQLGRAWAFQDARESIAKRYDSAFADLPVQLPAHAPGGDVHSWHLYVLRLGADANIGRNEFIGQMAERGVRCSVHFIPLHIHPYWRDLGSHVNSDFPVASAEFERAVSLPAFSSMTDAQVDHVISSVSDILS
ncbi:DegT/DnrJ/EryC1/StrS aminotransferase family protein [Dietzia sp. B32]|uniref:DegT/DnrJ/EryC1/StrS family aminotransferase n=1 Tax=Dietzia sp. B32 TaxID=2915130 RepID=UPI0021ADB93F|nr:DegT/DnrJ/EryC1/StrS family aminotransferase [Dietzia sp. B32]UVE96431.1 DegT/DnrJ/EryC1/StrS family aminotransferase [Dietzia sp. B32]